MSLNVGTSGRSVVISLFQATRKNPKSSLEFSKKRVSSEEMATSAKFIHKVMIICQEKEIRGRGNIYFKPPSVCIFLKN